MGAWHWQLGVLAQGLDRGIALWAGGAGREVQVLLDRLQVEEGNGGMALAGRCRCLMHITLPA